MHHEHLHTQTFPDCGSVVTYFLLKYFHRTLKKKSTDKCVRQKDQGRHTTDLLPARLETVSENTGLYLPG
jgi:hypothetical protein